jgi:uncharacterized alkaline shock family protein YloU
VSLVLSGPHGSITVPESVLVQIATRAAETVDGVRARRKRSVDVETRTVRLELAAERGGEALTAVGERVQDAVHAAFATACGLEVTVDVAFEELA